MGVRAPFNRFDPPLHINLPVPRETFHYAQGLPKKNNNNQAKYDWQSAFPNNSSF